MRQLLNKLLSPRLQLSPTCLIRLSADSSLLLLSRLSCPDSDCRQRGQTRGLGEKRWHLLSFLLSWARLHVGETCASAHFAPLIRLEGRRAGPGHEVLGASGATVVPSPQLFLQPEDESGGKKKEVVTSDQWIKSPATSDWMTFQGSAALCCWHYEASCLLEDERGFTRSHPSKQQAVEMEYWTRVKLQQVAKRVSGRANCAAVFPTMSGVLKVHFLGQNTKE